MPQFALPANSRVQAGRIWPAPIGASRTKRFRIYRWDPDEGGNPRLDVFTLDLDRCGPMALDALIKIKDEIDSTFTFRRSCREGVCGSCAMNIDGANHLACLTPIGSIKGDVRIYPLNHLAVIKDLVSDLTGVFAQYRLIKPWLQADTPPPEQERLQSRGERARIDGYWECILCFCCTGACPSWWWTGDRYLGPAVLLNAYRWSMDPLQPQMLSGDRVRRHVPASCSNATSARRLSRSRPTVATASFLPPCQKLTAQSCVAGSPSMSSRSHVSAWPT
jgi:succinate dehydrogenase / fumarate reductase iron-sulfur subunit